MSDTNDSSNNGSNSFINSYLQYIGDTESPIFYHRWCALSMVAASLGRSYFLEHGHFNIFPNLYVMLIGPPGARKSTAIKIACNILIKSGYDKISAERSSKEKFLLDLAGADNDLGIKENSILDQNLWGNNNSDEICEMYIACDEFNDFIGTNNIEFISMLGSLWDYNSEKPYENRIKSGKSVAINNPTINILGGNTPVNFVRAFPPEILGQGFFSRLILVQGENTGKKITFPVKPSVAATTQIVFELQRIKQKSYGHAKFPLESQKLLDKIYKSYKGIDDIRFESYTQRRFSHLLKLCLVISATHYSNTITVDHIVEANTILTHTEHLMPAALGEFGKSKNSDITHKIMQIIQAAYMPITINDLWQDVHKDLEKMGNLGDILRNLVAANKVIAVNNGFLARRTIIEEVTNDILDYGYLTTEEKEMKT